MRCDKMKKGSGLPKLSAIVLALVLGFGFSSGIRAEEPLEETAIVWIADISGSMTQADPERYWMDALCLGADLAPARSRLAFLAVNDTVVAQTTLLDLSQAESRTALKRTARNSSYQGYTNFNTGLKAALELLSASPARDKQLFFVADISESGFIKQRGDYQQEFDELSGLISRIIAGGIKVHLLFLDNPRMNQEFMPLWKELADSTGGEITEVEYPKNLAKKVEELYFSCFNYVKNVTTGINITDSKQEISLELPGFGMDRARIYIPAPVSIQARVDGLPTECEKTRSYTMIDLAAPFPAVLDLTLPPGENKEVRIYLLVDTEMSLSATEASITERKPDTWKIERVYQQKTSLTLNPDKAGSPFFPGSIAEDLNWQITVTDPLGKTAEAQDAQYLDGSFVFDFCPDNFGEYICELALNWRGLEISASTSAMIPQMPLPRPLTREIMIAIAIGLLLIILASILAAVYKKSKRESQIRDGFGDLTGERLNDSLGRLKVGTGLFTGKLDIYGIMLDGGRKELPPLSFNLEQMGRKKSLRLSTVLEMAGVPYHYPEASHIYFFPGQDGMLAVANNSQAVIYCGGLPRFQNQQATLTFGQKLRVIFEEDVNEYEIYYHQSLNMANSGKQIHLDLAN